MAGWGTGPYGSGPWGGGILSLGLVREFLARNSNPNEISLSWKKPDNLTSGQEIVVVRRKDAFPMELFNDDPTFASKLNTPGFTDTAQIEIFRGSLVRGTSGVGNGNTLTDGSATFPTTPSLKGRILRDSTSTNFRIASNTATTITVEEGTPADGQYVVLVDFPNSNNAALTGLSTSVGAGFLRDTSQNFTPGELSDRILVDSLGQRFVIVNNTTDLMSMSGTPAAGAYTVLQEFAGFLSPSSTVQGQFFYIDTFVNEAEADARTGTGLEDEQFYYYTAFTHRTGFNVAASLFASFGDADSTQSAALSTIRRDFQNILLDLWPNVFSQADSTGDFEDLMAVFGFGFNELYSFVNTFTLTNPDKMFYTILDSFALQTGLPEAGSQLGIDTYRRIICDMLPTFKLKGTKDGIVDFIRIITTWDATNGTKDSNAIADDSPNITALRFYSDTLGSNNTRLFGLRVTVDNDPFVSYSYTSGTGVIQYVSTVDLSNVVIGDIFQDGVGRCFTINAIDDAGNNVTIDPGQTVDTSAGGQIFNTVPDSESGRFFASLPGVIIPGFFDFREFVVEINNVALFVGESTNLTASNETTTLEDTSANFGGTNTLVGNFLIPKQGQVNDIFEIIANDTTTITVRGVARDLDPVGDYAVLSPLNTSRFQRINDLMTVFAPSFARMGLVFT